MLRTFPGKTDTYGDQVAHVSKLSFLHIGKLSGNYQSSLRTGNRIIYIPSILLPNNALIYLLAHSVLPHRVTGEQRHTSMSETFKMHSILVAGY